MDALSEDMLSTIIEILSVCDIKSLKLTSHWMSNRLSSLRNEDDFWRRRLQSMYCVKLNYKITNNTWHQLYCKVNSGRLDLEKKLIDFSDGGDCEAVLLLSILGADASAENNMAFRLASKWGHSEVVKILLKNGADVSAKDNEALRLASMNGNIKIVRILLENGVDISAKDNEALRLASWSEHIDVVKILLENGADASAKDNEALRLASQYSHTKVVELLKRYGASLSKRK